MSDRVYLFMGEQEELLDRARIYSSDGAAESNHPAIPDSCSCEPQWREFCFFRSEECEARR